MVLRITHLGSVYHCTLYTKHYTRPTLSIVITFSSYIALFLAEASWKRFTYYLLPWQTCYIDHLLKSLGNLHPLTSFKAPQVLQLQLPPLSITGYLFTGEWTEAPLSSPVAQAGRFVMRQLAYTGSNPRSCSWCVQRANHSTIATQYDITVQVHCMTLHTLYAKLLIILNMT